MIPTYNLHKGWCVYKRQPGSSVPVRATDYYSTKSRAMTAATTQKVTTK